MRSPKQVSLQETFNSPEFQQIKDNVRGLKEALKTHQHVHKSDISQPTTKNDLIEQIRYVQHLRETLKESKHLLGLMVKDYNRRYK